MTGPEPDYPLEDFVEAVRADQMIGTQDVADKIECSYELAYKKLHRLEDQGEVQRQKVANTIIWTVNDQ